MQRTSLHALCALVAFSLPLSAQSTWHVDVNGVAPGTGTPLDPYTSIQYALEHPSTVNNDVILVAPGTYYENLNFNGNGLALNQGVTVRGSAGAHRTVIRPAAPGHLAKGFLGGWQWKLEGLTFTGVQSPGDSALYIAFASSTVEVQDCVVRDNAGPGILGGYDLYLTNTTVTRNALGLAALRSHTLQVLNECIIWGNDVDLGFHNFTHISWSNVGNSFSGHQNTINADPLFVDPEHGDLHLQAGSPCIVSGIHPSGADMGAFHFDANEIPDSELYCAGGLNSVNKRGRIGFHGSSSLSGGDLSLDTSGCVPNQFGLFFYGAGTQLVPFGDGNLCVSAGGAGLFRLTPFQLNGFGKGMSAIDFEAGTTGQGQGALTAGSTWNFQFWYRDPLGPGGSGFNLSNALTLRFWE